MKIILSEDVYNLGEEGDVCDVANGYARNYLLPQGFAVVHSKQNLAIFESRKEAIEKRKEEKKKAAQGLKQRLEEISLTIKMPAGETGRLFGSVNNAVIAEALEKEGITIERKKIDVASSSIKLIGQYSVMIKLYSGEFAKIDVTVASTDGKAEAALAKKQTAAGAKEEAASRSKAEAKTETTAVEDVSEEDDYEDEESFEEESEDEEE